MKRSPSAPTCRASCTCVSSKMKALPSSHMMPRAGPTLSVMGPGGARRPKCATSLHDRCTRAFCNLRTRTEELTGGSCEVTECRLPRLFLAKVGKFDVLASARGPHREALRIPFELTQV